jgi:predicted nuclease with TOPRIM domain
VVVGFYLAQAIFELAKIPLDFGLERPGAMTPDLEQKETVLNLDSDEMEKDFELAEKALNSDLEEMALNLDPDEMEKDFELAEKALNSDLGETVDLEMPLVP